MAGCSDGSIKEFNLDTKHLICTLKGSSAPNDKLFTIKCYEINDKRYLISHSDQGIIDIWVEEI